MNFKALLGVAFALILIACFNLLFEEKTPEPEAVKNEAPHHHHVAPHGGCLIVLGEEFAHLELTLDPSSGLLQIYILDSMATMGVRLQQPSIELKLNLNAVEHSLVLKAQSNPLSGESEGNSSLFSVQSDLLKNLKQFKAEIPFIDIKGISFKNILIPFPEGNEH